MNTLFLAVFTYGRGIAGRQIQDSPARSRKQNTISLHGGNFATPHSQYYKNTVIKDTVRPTTATGYPG